MEGAGQGRKTTVAVFRSQGGSEKRFFVQPVPAANFGANRIRGANIAGNFKSSCKNRFDPARKKRRWFDHERTVTVISYPQKIQVASDDLPAENTGRLPAKNAGIYPQKLPDRKGIKETKEILSFLNTGCGTAFKPTTRETARLISGRLMEGYTVEDFKAVISSKAKEWKSRDEMRQFLCPATLFRPSNFEKYLQAAQTAAKSRPPEPAAYKPFPSMAAA